MHSCRTTDEKEKNSPPDDRQITLRLDSFGRGGLLSGTPCVSSYALLGATLTERVVGFLERYHKSIYGVR
jgi:hypothetical protein